MISMNKVKLYSPEILPFGFSYPDGFIKISEYYNLPDGFIWWFPTDEFDHAAGEWEMRHYYKKKGWMLLDNIDPIPFARNGDWAAFFDGKDHSGDPKVVVVDYGNRKNSYTVANFNAWLDRAMIDSGLK